MHSSHHADGVTRHEIKQNEHRMEKMEVEHPHPFPLFALELPCVACSLKPSQVRVQPIPAMENIMSVSGRGVMLAGLPSG